jgi:DNA invertase Pin-like site-specific DNA recombinase
MCGVFAEFERGILSERVKAGLNRARIDGKTLGRPIKVANIKAIVEGRNNGKTIRQLSNEHNLSIGKIHNVIKNQ